MRADDRAVRNSEHFEQPARVPLRLNVVAVADHLSRERHRIERDLGRLEIVDRQPAVIVDSGRTGPSWIGTRP